MKLAVILGAFVSGVIGSMGFGSGTVLIILLTVFLSFDQKTAQGVNLLFFVPCALYAIFFYVKKGLIKKQAVFPLVISGLFGAASGYVILRFLSPEFLRRMFGVLLILIAVKQLLAFLFKKLSKADSDLEL